ncbi:PRK06851 family protein [Lentibacillus halophilus]|uniref:PRK06851 family protein n=1 Tax=Lentibacillus halophilus TaxID=295065 RepID=A0ABP3JAC8_9BACI
MSPLHYYVTGNTAGGLVNHLDENIHDIDRIIALQHPSKSLKTAVIKHLFHHYDNRYLEVLQSSFANTYLDGIIIRDQSLAFIDESIATTYTSVIDLTQTFPLPVTNQPDINELMQKAYDSFAEGLHIHDNLEAIYINQMNFSRADAYIDRFINELLMDVPEKHREPRRYHRLFGTNTADGVVNVVPHLIENIPHVYYIKGRAGTGKSVFMKRIANACLDHGLDVELYYCSFDPESIDMVLVRALDFCIFDSTDPHEFFPERHGETIIDMYEKFVAPGTDEAYADEIHDVYAQYKSCMKQGMRYLETAGRRWQAWEKAYMQTVNDSHLKSHIQTIVHSLHK